MSRDKEKPVRCVNCGAVLHIWSDRRGGTYWKHCTGWRTVKACKNAQAQKDKP